MVPDFSLNIFSDVLAVRTDTGHRNSRMYGVATGRMLHFGLWCLHKNYSSMSKLSMVKISGHLDLFWVSYGHLSDYCSYGQKSELAHYQFRIRSFLRLVSRQKFGNISTWKLAYFVFRTSHWPHTNWGHQFSLVFQFTYCLHNTQYAHKRTLPNAISPPPKTAIIHS